MKQLELIRQKLVPTRDSALTAVPNPHLLKELWGWDGLYQGKRDIFLNPTLTSRLPLGEGSEVRHMETWWRRMPALLVACRPWERSTQ